MKLSEATARVIELARQFALAKAAELPAGKSGWVVVRLSDLPPPGPERPEMTALKQFLRSLPAGLVYQIMAIMYLGRGDYDTDDLLDYYVHLSDVNHTHDYAIRHMANKIPLSEYLERGLSELEADGKDVDRVFE